jgi:hypothetical protein
MTRGLLIPFLFLFTIMMLGLPRDMDAQCVVLKVIVDGQAHSDSRATQVLVRVHANRGKKTYEAVTAPQENHFHVAVGSTHSFPSVYSARTTAPGIQRQLT